MLSSALLNVDEYFSSMQQIDPSFANGDKPITDTYPFSGMDWVGASSKLSTYPAYSAQSLNQGAHTTLIASSPIVSRNQRFKLIGFGSLLQQAHQTQHPTIVALIHYMVCIHDHRQPSLLGRTF